jgi:hypothetical protein
MGQRESNLIWLKDVLEHLQSCHKQLEWTTETETIHVLTETMLRDLDCCRKLLESLQRRATYRDAV